MTITKPITVDYSGITITYLEREDQWQFELRGRERKADSLTKAKEAIDKPAPKDEGPPFERIAVYLDRYGKFSRGKVTSEADGGYGNLKYYWVVVDGTRSKEPGYNLIKVTAANTEKMEKWKQLDAQINKLGEERQKLSESMEKLK